MQGAIRIAHRWRLVSSVAVAVMLGLVLVLSALGTKTGAAQPPLFDHKAMVEKGMSCLFCHADAYRSPVAGIPSMEQCMGCHQVIASDSEAIKSLAVYWADQKAIPWKRVNQLPRFVYFSHQVHIASALNCERCHGDVGSMTLAPSTGNMNMGWCLSCHNAQPNAAQLRDCIVCHQ
jgi:c(7)-type cytochrome triheme protein